MAEILKEDLKRTSAGRPDAYPWDEWLDGRARKFVRGVDFHTRCESFRRTCAFAARRAGLRIKTSVLSDTEFVMQAIVKNGKPKKK